MCELSSQSRLGILVGGFKKTGAKTEHLRQSGNTMLGHWVYEKTDVKKKKKNDLNHQSI